MKCSPLLLVRGNLVLDPKKTTLKLERVTAVKANLNYQRSLIQLLGARDYFRYRLTRRMKPVRVSIGAHAVWVRRGTPDLSVALDSLGGEFDVVRQFVPEAFSGLIVDAGAYIGSSALALHQLFPRARILAIEPDPENFEVLQMNVSLVANIIPVSAALVGGEKSTAKLYDRRTGKWGLTLVSDPADVVAPSLVAEVETISLRQVVECWGNPAVLKLDVEGGEYDIFANARELCNEIPVILVELHDGIVPGCGEALRALSGRRKMERDAGEKVLSYDERLLADFTM